MSGQSCIHTALEAPFQQSCTEMGLAHLTLRLEQRGVAEPCADHYRGYDCYLQPVATGGRGWGRNGGFNSLSSVCVSWNRVKIHFLPLFDSVQSESVWRLSSRHLPSTTLRRELARSNCDDAGTPTVDV